MFLSVIATILLMRLLILKKTIMYLTSYVYIKTVDKLSNTKLMSNTLKYYMFLKNKLGKL